MRSVELQEQRMLSAMIPFLHSLMAQAGLAQKLKEHVLLHSLKCRPGTKPFLSSSLSRRMASGDVHSMLHFGSFLTERERAWEGQAEENACRSVPAMEHDVEHDMGDTFITVPSNWDHWVLSTSV